MINFDTYLIPSGTLPLAEERNPFQKLTKQTRGVILKQTLDAEEKVGRLSTAIRSLCKINTPKLGNLVIELHLDCCKLSEDEINHIVSLGLEPDHFHIFLPKIYPEHYTLKYQCCNKDRFNNFVKKILKTTEVLKKYMINKDITGFFELEMYDLDQKRLSKNFIEPTKIMVSNFPLSKNTLVETSSLAFKVADIHIKTPTALSGGSNSPKMSQLRTKIKEAGFYEVQTEAGNLIYTAQFIHMKEAKIVYDCLCKYFKEAGGIKDITLESCRLFWKNKNSAIPPLMKLARSL